MLKSLAVGESSTMNANEKEIKYEDIKKVIRSRSGCDSDTFSDRIRRLQRRTDGPER